MRTIKQLPVPQDSDAKFPQSTILNESGAQEGTPVVREIYGDILTNMYKLLELTEQAPTGDEDSEDTQYQIIDALRLFANTMNDVEQVISLAGSVWSVPLNLSILPNKYVFVARASDAYNSGVVYTFKGTGAAPVISFTSDTGFNASDLVMVVIDGAGVKAINLTPSTSNQTVATAFGSPISYNAGAIMRYMSEGNILTDAPTSVDLQSQIRAATADPLATIYDTFVLEGFVLCFVFLPATVTYVFYQFDLLDLNTAVAVPVSGIAIPVGSDEQPYAYTDGEFIYLTNRAGTLADDFEITRLSYNPATPQITFVGNFALNAAFQKTSNVVVKEDEFLFTFINSVLSRYEIATGLVSVIGDFKTINGQIFGFNGGFYYSNGEIGTKWSI